MNYITFSATIAGRMTGPAFTAGNQSNDSTRSGQSMLNDREDLRMDAMQSVPLETTQDLVERTRQGDDSARDRLIRRYLPIISRWAHGRIPAGARDLNETADLVQVTLMRAFQALPSFQVEGSGAFYAFLRTVMTNILRDEARRAFRRPRMTELENEIVDRAPSPPAVVASAETLQAYERALQALDEGERDLIVMHIELGFSNVEIAEATQSPSPNAARMRVARALARLAQAMRDHRE